MAPVIYRVAFASLLVVGFGACGRGDCEDDVRFLVNADAGCPSPDAVEKNLEADHENASIERPPAVGVIAPGTICWYLGEATPDQSCTNPTRDDVVWSMKSRYQDPYGVLRACDGEQPLVGEWLPSDATTPREAAAASIAECPSVPSSGSVEAGELVGADFVTGTLSCTYHVDYICDGSGGCGAPPSGGLQ